MKDSIFKEITEILGLILRANPSEISEGTGREDYETWDSLSHLNIILAMEEQYGVGFTPEEIEGIRTAGDIAGLVASKLDSR